MTKYFGPLNKQWCNYFLIISMIMFALLIVAIFTEIIFVFKNYKMLSFRMAMHGFLLLINAYLAYMVNRLLYTMCVKSV